MLARSSVTLFCSATQLQATRGAEIDAWLQAQQACNPELHDLKTKLALLQARVTELEAENLLMATVGVAHNA